MNHQQDFLRLKEKYDANEYKDKSISSPLYFLLRKADLGIKLYDAEERWLLEQNLSKTLLIIQERFKYVNKEGAELSAKFSELKAKYKATNYSESWISSPLYFILLKLDTGISLTKEESRWLFSQRLNDTNTIAHKMSDFIKLKIKYKAVKYPDSFPGNSLDLILQKIDKSERITQAEYSWLVDHQLLETLGFVKQQEAERRSEFARLKDKYQAISHNTKDVSSPLYLILTNLEMGNILKDTEIDWLKEQELVETLAIYEERQQEQEFKRLKIQYEATSYQDTSPKSHLYKVLKIIDSGSLLSLQDINFLKKRDLNEVIQIANDQYADILKAKIRNSQLLESEEIEWLRINGYQDILDLIEIQKFLHLKSKYDVAYYQDNSPNSPLYLILQKLESSQRLEPIDIAWLQNKKLYHGKIFITYHSIEANFYREEYKQTGNKWNLVNASSHLRKADKSKLALRLTDNLPMDTIKENKLKAALLTTRGGAYRDIEELDQAEKSALQAMKLQPNSHHPYTLMGAICYDRGDYPKGDSWFAEAIKRGANPRDVDSEIKSVLKKIKDEKQLQELLAYLYKKNETLYQWANEYIKKRHQQDSRSKPKSR